MIKISSNEYVERPNRKGIIFTVVQGLVSYILLTRAASKQLFIYKPMIYYPSQLLCWQGSKKS